MTDNRTTKMKNPERALASTVGMMHGLFMALQALAKTHPNPEAALRELDIASNAGLASLEPHPIDEATITGFKHAIDGINRALLHGKAKQ